MLPFGLGFGCAAVCWLFYRGMEGRDWRVDLDDQLHLQITMCMAMIALSVALTLRGSFSVAKLALTTAAASWIPVRLCQVRPVAERLTTLCGGLDRARSAGWFVVAIVGLYGPRVAGSELQFLLAARAGIAATAALFIVQNGRDNTCSEIAPTARSTDD